MNPEHSIRTLLAQHGRNKDALINGCRRLAEADDRIAALWLFGSEGRGEADDLSDVDVFVAFQDGSANEIDRVDEWLGRLGSLRAVRESPYNAPDGGRYFAAVFEAEPLPILVDSYWQPASRAELGTDARVLADKVGVRAAMTPRTTFELIPAVRDSIPYVPPPDPVARLRNEVGWFWMDIPVVAKHHVRGLPTTAEEMRSLQAVIGHVAEYLGLQPQATGHDNLRRLAGEMDELLSHTRAAPFRCRDREFAWRWIQFSEWATDASGGQKESIAPEQ